MGIRDKTQVTTTATGDEELLSNFGYKQELHRSLKMFSMFAISFSVISLTTGIFTNFQFAISHYGAASIWLWPVAFGGAMILAFVLAEARFENPSGRLLVPVGRQARRARLRLVRRLQPARLFHACERR